MLQIEDFGLRRLRGKDFTYDWCDDHTIVFVWCPQCEAPTSVRTPIQAAEPLAV